MIKKFLITTFGIFSVSLVSNAQQAISQRGNSLLSFDNMDGSSIAYDVAFFNTNSTLSNTSTNVLGSISSIRLMGATNTSLAFSNLISKTNPAGNYYVAARAIANVSDAAFYSDWSTNFLIKIVYPPNSPANIRVIPLP